MTRPPRLAGAIRIGLRRAVAVLGPQLVVARLAGREGLQRAEVGRRRHQRRVAGRQQQPAQELERLLRARGDDDVVLLRRARRACPCAARSIAAAADSPRSPSIAGRSPPAPRRRARPRRPPAPRLAGNSAGSGMPPANEMMPGPVQQLQQLADLGGAHALGAGRIGGLPLGRLHVRGHDLGSIVSPEPIMSALLTYLQDGASDSLAKRRG